MWWKTKWHTYCKNIKIKSEKMKTNRGAIVAVMALFVLATVVSADSYHDCLHRCYKYCWGVPVCYPNCPDACSKCLVTPDHCLMQLDSFPKSCQTRCAHSKCADIKGSFSDSSSTHPNWKKESSLIFHVVSCRSRTYGSLLGWLLAERLQSFESKGLFTQSCLQQNLLCKYLVECMHQWFQNVYWCFLK